MQCLKKLAFPVVRFADGEYHSTVKLKVQKLYKQVEKGFKLFVYKKLHKKY